MRLGRSILASFQINYNSSIYLKRYQKHQETILKKNNTQANREAEDAR